MPKTYHSLLAAAVFLLFSAYPVKSQQPDQMFYIVHLPRKTNYSKVKLNKEIAAAKTKAAVRDTLRKKPFSSANIIIRIKRSPTEIRWWTLNDDPRLDRDNDNIILQSRDVSKARFYRLSDFRTFFKDTLVLLDTLAVELYIHEENYPDDRFALSYIYNKKEVRRTLPFDGENLFFTPSLLSNCYSSAGTTMQIFNSANPDRTLATVFLKFLSPTEKEQLLDFAVAYKAFSPRSSNKDVIDFTANYCTKTIGRPFYPQLVEWLSKHLSR